LQPPWPQARSRHLALLRAPPRGRLRGCQSQPRRKEPPPRRR
jgi:hypothetical protein